MRVSFPAAMLTAALSLLAIPLWNVQGDDPSAPPSQEKPSKAKKSLPQATPEREAAARMFVQMNHPDLVAVLDQLQADKPAEYDRAIRELFKTCEQLNRTMDQDPQKYALDLEAWKIKSRIQLLTARAGLSEDAALDQQLREAIQRQQELRVEQLVLQREQVARRLQKLDEQLEQARSDQASQVEKQFTTLMRGVKKARANSAKKPAS